jgi:hypothetical protein
MEENTWVALVMFVCVFGSPVFWIACHYANEAFIAWQEITLKREMIARGYSAQEIKEVCGGRRNN